MGQNIVLTKIIISSSPIPTSNIFSDPIFYIGLITLFVAIFGVWFSIRIFRPKVHIEIKNVLYKELLKSYELVISNNGNVMAEDIQIEYSDDLENALNDECYNKNGIDFGSFKFIKDNLSKKIKYLPAGKEIKGLLIAKEDDDKNNSPLLFEKEFTVYLTYKNSITGRIYKKQSVKLELKKSDWLTDYHMTDNLGYDLQRIIENLSELNNSSYMLLKNQGKLLNSTEHLKLHNATTIFKSLNKTEKMIILKLLGNKGSRDESFFESRLKKYMENSNNGISKKLGKLKLDEYKFFMKVARDFRDNGL